MKSKCTNCEIEFEYHPSQSSGKYCSNKCQGEHSVKQRLTEDSIYSQSIRKYILSVRGEVCEECGQTNTHNGKPLTLQVDHINGNNKDNRVENLRVICPNCHTQTHTWGVKNASDEGKERLKTAAKLGRDIQLGKLPKGSRLVR
jgi:5-methylcytosine-specific restriction endonuclease McrA